MKDKTTPRNQDEQEILGYRHVLELIHDSYESIPVRASYILQLHGELLKYTTFSYGGKFKTTANEIAKTLPNGEKETIFKPLEPYETPGAVEELCEQFSKAIKEEIVDSLILIPIFILDFLFKDSALHNLVGIVSSVPDALSLVADNLRVGVSPTDMVFGGITIHLGIID